jgi:hypothetical protein
MTMDESERKYCKVSLKVDDAAVRREVLLAEPTAVDSVFVVKSIPAFLFGVAPGDMIRVTNSDSGEFQIVARGGNVAIRLFLKGTLDREDVSELIERVTSVGGTYEVGFNKDNPERTSLLLLSVGIDKGFGFIEQIMKGSSATGWEWEYANVYDKLGKPLNWW